MQQSADTFNPTIFVVAFLAFDFVIIAFALFMAYRRSVMLREAWQAVSMRTGTTFNPGNFMTRPTLSGDYRRRAINMFTYRHGGRHRRRRSVYTRITLAVSNQRGGKLGLSPEGFLSGIGRALGSQDIIIGGEAFDKSFMVRSTPPEFAVMVLGDPMLQDTLVRLRQAWSFSLELDGGTLTYSARGIPTGEDLVMSIFEALSDVADKIEGGVRDPMF